MRTQITEAQAEKIADARVMAALRRDRRYLHADDAVSQAIAEEIITAEIMQAMGREYAVYTITTHEDRSETYAIDPGLVVATVRLDGDWITRRYFGPDEWDETSLMWKSDAQMLARRHAETMS